MPLDEEHSSSLETQLRNLQPSALSQPQIKRLLSGLQKSDGDSNDDAASLPFRSARWLWGALALCMVVLLSGISFVWWHGRSEVRSIVRVATAEAGETGDDTQVNPLPPGSAGELSARSDETSKSNEDFVELSSEAFLRATERGEVIRVEGAGLYRPVHYAVEASELWMDPATATRLQIIRPQEGVVLLPVDTL